MKTLPSILAISLLACVTSSCRSDKEESRYIDLSTGNAVELKEDPKTGLMVSIETGKPVEIYVDNEEKDTIRGLTGTVINGKVHRSEDGKYLYQEAGNSDAQTNLNNENSHAEKSGSNDPAKYEVGEYKVKNGDYKYKREVEKDGDITIKDGNKKIKIDGETGKKKVKIDN